ncbi:MAG: type II toxin-antitoxin system VapC family toxin [Oligoflexus sp.]|nr:type II toxin-antitoxin system VapC family toxin [Pseudopedobacter sp.]
MAGINYIIDTNIIIELFRGNEKIKASFKKEDKFYLPFAVLGELYLGAYRSSNSKKHLSQINEFLNICTVLIADKETSNQYGILKTMLLKKGKPIPENDIWIAAITKQFKMKLITLDKHFLEIDVIDVLKL